MTAYPVNRQHPESKEDATAQFGDTENCLNFIEQG
jgi:hypothetical protein